MMLDDAVTRAALGVLSVVFFGLLTAGMLLYLAMRSGERGKPRPPHKGQMWLAGLIGIAVPALLLLYALFFSPSATLTPAQMHHREPLTTQGR